MINSNILRRSSYALLLIAIATSWFVQIEPAPTDLLVALAAVVAGLSWLAGRSLPGRQIFSPRANILLLIFAVTNFLLPFQSTGYASLRFMLLTLYLVGFYFLLVILLQDFPAVKIANYAYVAAAIITTILIWAAFFAHYSLAIDLEGQRLLGQFSLLLHGRPEGFFKDPNVAGPFLVSACLFCLSCLLVAKHDKGKRFDWLTWAYASAFALLVNGLILSFSRTAVIGLGVGAVSLLFIQRRQVISNWRNLILGIGLAGLVLAGLFSYQPFATLAIDRFVPIQAYDYAGRFYAWQAGVKMFLLHPSGWGPGSFERLAPEIQAMPIVTPSAHSTLLRVLAENGLLGGFALYGFFLALIWRGYRLHKQSASSEDRLYAAFLTSSLCGMVVSGFLIDALHWRHFWLLLGMSAALVNVATTQSAKRNVPAKQAGVKHRLLLLITQSEFGGAQKYVYYLATSLPKDRYEVSVACGTGGLLIPKLQEAGIEVSSIPSLVREFNPIRDFLAFLDLLWLIHCKRPHIVHTNSTKAGLLGRLAASLADVPIIVFTAHGFVLNEPMGILGRSLFTVIERVGGMLSGNIIAVSEADRCTAIQHGVISPDRIVTIHNGLDIESLSSPNPSAIAQKRVELGLFDSHQVIGVVANFYATKGLPYFLQAAAHVREAFPEARFTLVGDGERRCDLEALASELNLDSSVLFLGQRNDVPELLPLFDVFVLPSVKEGLPFALLEAMAAARPIVATTVGGVPEMITDGETGLLVPPQDPDALAKAIIALLTDRDKAQRMGLAARERVLAHFTLERMLEETEQLYQQLLARKCPQRVWEPSDEQTR
jgi:glycosyltransferase involved in cell wall biosynthesis/O-antigen ligase